MSLQTTDCAKPSSHGVALIGTTLGLAWFFVNGGGHALIPTNVDWAMRGDWFQTHAGWLFFRNAHWSWPLGQLPDYPYPMGTTLGYADAIPWMAVLFKILSPLLPFDFQYLGIWFALCFALQGFFGAKIAEQLSARWEHRIFGAALFVLAPVLIMRIGHVTLCGHWLVLSMLWLYLRPCPDRHSVWVTLGLIALINGLTAGIHPYMPAMTYPLSIAVLAKMKWKGELTAWPALLGAALVVGAVVFGVAALFGFFHGGVLTAIGGFGDFSADLLTLFNPGGLSRYLPAFPTGPGQYEGFGYLGLGVIALGVAGLVSLRRRREPIAPRWATPLVVVCALMAFYSLSSIVTVAGHPVATMRNFYRPFTGLVGSLRASGRFIWPLHYACVAAAISMTVRAWRDRPAVASILLAIAVLSQFFEVDSRPYRSGFGNDTSPRLRSSEWTLARGSYRHFILFPPQTYDAGGHGCPKPQPGYPLDYYVAFVDLAYRLGTTVNSAHYTRVNVERQSAHCDQIQKEVETHPLAEDSIYVVHPASLPVVTRPEAHAACGRLEGYVVCVSANRRDAFRTALEQHPL
jgi:hypothetical protein